MCLSSVLIRTQPREANSMISDMVLEDVTELFVLRRSPSCILHLTKFSSDYSGNQEKLPKILLNGNNVCMVSPGACFNEYSYLKRRISLTCL